MDEYRWDAVNATDVESSSKMEVWHVYLNPA